MEQPKHDLGKCVPECTVFQYGVCVDLNSYKKDVHLEGQHCPICPLKPNKITVSP